MNIAVISDLQYECFYKGCVIHCVPSACKVTPEDWVLYDAVFLIEPVNANAVKWWTGHPHARFLNCIGELHAEIEFLKSGMEIEKKLLIRMPDLKELEKYCPYRASVEQIYLQGEDGSHRIRKRTMGDTVSYIETVKNRISGTTCEETENRIDEEQYSFLANIADPEKHPIFKDRYCFFYKKQYFELDVYDFWNDRATLELELKSEGESYSLPPEIELIKDVSDDMRYKNNYLAGIRYEDYYTELL